MDDIRTFNPFKAAVSRPGPPELLPGPGFLSYQSERGGRMEILVGLQGLGLDSLTLKIKKRKKKSYFDNLGQMQSNTLSTAQDWRLNLVEFR